MRVTRNPESREQTGTHTQYTIHLHTQLTAMCALRAAHQQSQQRSTQTRHTTARTSNKPKHQRDTSKSVNTTTQTLACVHTHDKLSISRFDHSPVCAPSSLPFSMPPLTQPFVLPAAVSSSVVRLHPVVQTTASLASAVVVAPPKLLSTFDASPVVASPASTAPSNAPPSGAPAGPASSSG